MPTLGELVVSLTAETGPFNAAMNTVSGKIGQLSATVAKVGAAVSAVGVPFALMAKSAIDNADAFGKMAQKAGTSVEFLSSMAHAANLSDISNEDLTKSLVKLSAKLQDAASGSKETAAVFQSIGIAATNSKGGLENVDKILPQIADRFAKMEDGAEKTALAVDLFGKSGADLIPLLNAGAKGLAEMRAESDRLGVTVSTSTAQAAEKFNDALTRVGASIKGVFNTIISSPIVEKLADLIVQAAEMTAGFARAHPNIVAVAGALGAFAAIAGPAAVTIGLTATAITSMGAASTIAAAGVVGLGAALGVGIGLMANYAIEASGLQKEFDGLVASAARWALLGSLVDRDGKDITQDAKTRENAVSKLVETLTKYGIAVDRARLSDNAYLDSLVKQFSTLPAVTDKRNSATRAVNEHAAALEREKNRIKELNKTLEEQKAAMARANEERAKMSLGFVEALIPTVALERELAMLGPRLDSQLFAVYGQRAHEAAVATREHGFEVSGLVARLDEMFAASDSVQRLSAAIAAIGNEIDGILRPADAWNEKLTRMFELGFTNVDAIRAFGDQILKAIDIQRIHGEVIDGEVAKLEELARAFSGIARLPDLDQRSIDLAGALPSNEKLKKLIGELSEAMTLKLPDAKPDEVMDALIRKTKESEAEARRWEQTWSQVMANIVTGFSRGITDVIFKAKSLTGALADIGKTAGRAFTEAFFAELFSPLTKMLASWGRRLASTLQTAVFPKIAGAIGLGAALPAAGGAAGAAGVGAAGAGAGAGAGAAGAGGGLGSSIAAFATNPITIGVAGAVGAVLLAKHFIGRGRRAADDFGGEVESPFASRLGEILGQFNSERSAGVLTREEALSTRTQLADLVRTYNAQAAAFAALGDSQAKVVEQARVGKIENFGENFSRIFDDVNATIKGLTGPLAGSGLAGTGRTLSASDHFSDAVDRFVPAVEKLATAGGGSVVNNYTINSDLNVAVDGSADPQALIDKLMRDFRDNVNGIRIQIATGIQDTLKGVVVSTS